jgi:hypothetical protein
MEQEMSLPYYFGMTITLTVADNVAPNLHDFCHISGEGAKRLLGKNKITHMEDMSYAFTHFCLEEYKLMVCRPCC